MLFWLAGSKRVKINPFGKNRNFIPEIATDLQTFSVLLGNLKCKCTSTSTKMYLYIQLYTLLSCNEIKLSHGINTLERDKDTIYRTGAR